MHSLVNRSPAKIPQELLDRQLSGISRHLPTELLSQALPWLPKFPDRSHPKPDGWQQSLQPERQTHGGRTAPFPGDLKEGIRKAQERLLRVQNHEDGYWCAELRADTTLESDAIMLWNALGRGDSPKIRRLANHILSEQLVDGGWPIHRNGPSEISATVKAYWALKFAGHPSDSEPLRRARRRIAGLGGIHRTNTYTKFYLALFGQYDWRGVPTVPPEMILFPKWFTCSIYAMSSWTRAIVLPLCILGVKRPRFPCPEQARLDELFPDTRRHIPLKDVLPDQGPFSWRTFFLMMDSALKALEGRGPRIPRERALRLVEEEILTRLKDSDGLGAIYPGIMNTLLALKTLGYPDHDPVFRREYAQFEKLEIDRGDKLEMQPCRSPVWDTALSVIALSESGLRQDDPSLVRSAQWLLSKEIRQQGDWKIKNPSGPVGGWAFQFNNPWYPDVDDTAMVLLALRQVRLEETLSNDRAEAFERGLDWLISMQCREGGWAAFDKDNTNIVLTKIPFADHNAMIDPPTVDITGRILEILGRTGYGPDDPRCRRAIDFILANQESDGSWFGRWGVNYLYGTWQVLRGLAAVGFGVTDPAVQRAARWLLSVQRPDGGWGETCRTYEDPSAKGAGPSTPSQTAWAIMGLIAAGHAFHPKTLAGIRRLLATQRDDGGWDESEYTGTGFPKVFYLEYTLYRDYFPLMALGAFSRALEARQKKPKTAAAVY